MAAEREGSYHPGRIIQYHQTEGIKISIKKYYGFIPWASVQTKSRKNIDYLYQTILLILFRLRSSQFMANLIEISSIKMEKIMLSMDTRYGRILLRKGLRAIK